MLVNQAKTSSSKEAFRYLEGDRWVSLSWTETKEKAFQLAAGLLALGIEREDRVAIASNTRMESSVSARSCSSGIVRLSARLRFTMCTRWPSGDRT